MRALLTAVTLYSATCIAQLPLSYGPKISYQYNHTTLYNYTAFSTRFPIAVGGFIDLYGLQFRTQLMADDGNYVREGEIRKNIPYTVWGFSLDVIQTVRFDMGINYDRHVRFKSSYNEVEIQLTSSRFYEYYLFRGRTLGVHITYKPIKPFAIKVEFGAFENGDVFSRQNAYTDQIKLEIDKDNMNKGVFIKGTLEWRFGRQRWDDIVE